MDQLPLVYYATREPARGDDTSGILYARDGRCGGFFVIMVNVFEAQNIVLLPVSVWLIPSPEGWEPLDFYVKAGPGQNNSSPRRDFKDHKFARYDFVSYDPSYGTARLTQQAWEDDAIESIKYRNDLGQEVTRPNREGVPDLSYSLI